MSDRSQEQPSFELPPQPESLEPGAEQAPNSQEQLVHTPEQTGNQAGVAAPTLPPVPLPDPAQAAQPQPGPTNIVVKQAPTTGSGLAASDVDLIEKEWVDRAKNIVAKTQDDPYIQKNEISKVKSEYIQKRFKKSLPAQETGA